MAHGIMWVRELRWDINGCCPFSDSHAEKVRVTVTSARGTVNISNIGLYYAEPLVDKTMKVTLSDVPVDGWKTVGMDVSRSH